MDFIPALIAIVFGYLMGSLSFTRIVTRWVNPKVDIDHVEVEIPGSQEPTKVRIMGATTASIKLGGGVGCLIAILDALKVAVPSLFFKLAFPDQPYFLLVATAGMVGHNFPVYYHFRGGVGLSALYGGFFVVDWVGAIVSAFAGLIFGLFMIRDMLIAYIAGMWFMIPWLWFTTHNLSHLLYALAVNLVFFLTFIPELREHIQARRSGEREMTNLMQAVPMGRGMLKIMQFFGLEKKSQDS